MMPDVSSARAIFFEAMSAIDGQKAQTISIPEIPGSKAFLFVKHAFRVLDYCLDSPDTGKISGTTTIWYGEHPVWVMNSGGWFKKTVIPLRRRFIHCGCPEYELREFEELRDARPVGNERYIYENVIHIKSFSEYEGVERVYDQENQVLGYCAYFATSLLKD